MNRYRWLWSSFLVVTFALTPALAAKEAADTGETPKKKRERKKPKRKTGLRGYYGVVASVCKLTEEQVEKLKEALKPYQEAQKANKQKLADLRKAQAEARKAKDKAKAAEIGKQIKEIQAPINALRAKAMDVLTQDQKILWEGHLLYQSSMGRFKKTGLDEAQQKKIREMCAAKAKEMFEAKDEKAKRALRAAVAKEIHDDVLTPEQQAKAKAPKKRGPKGKKKDR